MGLKASVVMQQSINEKDRAHLCALMKQCYEGIDDIRFMADLANKTHVILLRHAQTESIVGFSTLRISTEKMMDTEQKTYEADIIFSGDTVILPAYWGQKSLQIAFASFCLLHRIKHPTRTIYWMLLTKGFRTYLLAVNYFSAAYPRWNRETPQEIKRFKDALCLRWWGNAYNPETEILSFDGSKDRVGADVDNKPSAAKMHHPDVKYFFERNPGHAQGDELVCMIHFSWPVIFWGFMRAFRLFVRQKLR